MRILFITANRLGDAILSTGLLDELHRQRPKARFTVVCGPAAAGVFTAAPNLERIIVMRKKPWARHWWDLWKQVAATRRSEEHTSDLQSLMRISYAAFCLKKK